MTKNKNLKKILFLLIICVFVLLVYKIIQIYAVFHSELEAIVKLENGTWNITVNGTKISTGVEEQFSINQISTTQNSHVKPDKLAPGLSGSFEIVINPENTNVSIKYDITLNEEELGDTNLKIKSVQEIDNEEQLIKTEENTYTGIIPLEDINNGVKHRIKVEIEWEDVATGGEKDTTIGVNHEFKIPIIFRASQYLGENIISATEEQV